MPNNKQEKKNECCENCKEITHATNQADAEKYKIAFCKCHSEQQKKMCNCPETEDLISNNTGALVFCNCPCHSKEEKKRSQCCNAPSFTSVGFTGRRKICNACGKPFVSKDDSSGQTLTGSISKETAEMINTPGNIVAAPQVENTESKPEEWKNAVQLHIVKIVDETADDIFPELRQSYQNGIQRGCKKMIPFISNLLADARQEEIKRIEKMARKIYARLYTEENKAGYDAIQEIINNLTQE